MLVFLATATRLAAARREQRFAAMRLVGATPRQMSVIAGVETTVAAISGVIGGFVLFVILQPALDHVSITGVPFAPGDLSLNAIDVFLVALGVPVAAALASRVALRRVVASPLGVSRRVTPPAPRLRRLVPLLAGLVWLAVFVLFGKSDSNVVIYVYFIGFLLLMVGLISAGPWLTDAVARTITGRTNRADVLLAGRRLSDDPRTAFRSISGLVLALFLASLASGIVTTIIADKGAPAGGQVAVDTLVGVFGKPNSSSVEAQFSIPTLPSRLTAELAAIKGVRRGDGDPLGPTCSTRPGTGFVFRAGTDPRPRSMRTGCGGGEDRSPVVPAQRPDAEEHLGRPDLAGGWDHSRAPRQIPGGGGGGRDGRIVGRNRKGSHPA